jgi:glutamate racemase
MALARPIGIFDSGIGGLSVLKALVVACNTQRIAVMATRSTLK